MNWLTTALVLLSSILLLTQSLQYLRRDHGFDHVRWFGILTLIFTGVALLVYFVLSSGIVVVSPEFGLMMTRGRTGLYTVVLFIAAIAIGAGIGLQIARSSAGQRSRWALLLGLSVVAALVSTIPLFFDHTPLNPEAPTSHQIHACNIWWPPLLIWVVTCGTFTVLSAFKVHSKSLAIWLVTAITTTLAFSFLPTARSEVFDSLTELSVSLWIYCLVVALPLNMGLTTRLSLRLPGAISAHRGRWRTALTLLGGLVGLGLGVFILNDRQAAPYARWVWIGWLAVFGAIAVLNAYKGRTTRDKKGDSISPLAVRYSGLLVGMVVLALVLPSFAEVLGVYPLGIFFTATLGWMVLAEAVLPGPIRPLTQWDLFQQIKEAQSPLRDAIDMLWKRFKNGAKRTSAFLKSFFPGNEPWPVTIFKILMVLVVVIVLSEIPHHGKTLILPINIVAKKDSLLDGYERGMSDQLLHSFLTLQKDLRTDDVSIDEFSRGSEKQKSEKQKGEKHRGDAKFKFLTPGEVEASSFSKVSELEFAGTKIPLDMLISPILTPVRNFFGVQVIRGSLQIDAPHYRLLAHSNKGVSWSAAGESDEKGAPVVQLADALALQIMQSETGVAVPKSLTALNYFKEGLAAWRRYSEQSRLADLQTAIEGFRAAIDEDPGFGMAHYRLGLALLSDGQPGAAIGAFRKAIAVEPALFVAHQALANTLINPTRYYQVPAAARPRDEPSPEATDVQRQEAKALLQHVIGAATAVSTRNLASAYFGLCLIALDELNEAQEPSIVDAKRKLSYFYCKRAGAVYAGMPVAQKLEQTARSDEATVLNQMGVILELADLKQESYEVIKTDVPNIPDWFCKPYLEISSSEGTKYVLNYELNRGAYVGEAVKYYRRASDLWPEEQTIRCNHAMAAYAHGDRDPMNELDNDQKAHLHLAVTYRQAARYFHLDKELVKTALSDDYFRLALDEYSRAAFAQDHPTPVTSSRFFAANGFAYTFWEWRLLRPDKNEEQRQNFSAEWAEIYARDAIALSANEPVDKQAMAYSTLGEVLLALARPQEAYEQLEKSREILERGKLRDNALFHEIAWDLAQAYICFRKNEKDRKISAHSDNTSKNLEQKAVKLLENIYAEERDREYKPFTDTHQRLDPTQVLPACERVNDAPRYSVESVESDDPTIPFSMRLEYETAPICNWLGVRGIANGQDSKIGMLMLSIWGGGINIRIPADGKAVVTLGYKPRDTSNYYFAKLEQLENDKYEPQSTVSMIPTKSGCGENMITLRFEKKYARRT